MATVHEMAVLARCTRGEKIQWDQVAKQLGRNLHSVRSELDPTYMRDAVSAPQSPKPPMRAPINGIRFNSKTLVVMTLAQIARPARSLEIAAACGKKVKAVVHGLTGARSCGLVQDYGPPHAIAYSLTPAGREYADLAASEALIRGNAQ